MTKGLPLTYNRDLQEDKPPVFDSLDTTAICAEVLAGTLEGIRVNSARCAAAVSDPALLATDLADYLVERGVPFREAHHAVGAVVKLAEQQGKPLNQLATADVKACHPGYGDDWAVVFDLKRAMAKRTGTGMPSPAQFKKQLARWAKVLATS
jgi:argininosuccinate lyase